MAAVAGTGAMHKCVHQRSVHPDTATGFPAQRHQPRVLLPDGRQVQRASPRQAQEALWKATAVQGTGLKELESTSSDQRVPV